MTSPVSSLSKSRKTPLFFPEMSAQSPLPLPNESENLPRIGLNSGYSYKNSLYNTSSSSNINTLPDIKINSSDDKKNLIPFKSYLDESDLIDEFTTQMAVNNLKKRIPNSKSLSGPNDLELMQLMMSKIKQTESKCANLERELAKKEKKIEILEEKLDFYKKQKIDYRDDLVEELEEKNVQLRNQILEMEAFLSDYGLHWIGNTTSDMHSTLNEAKADEFKIDYDLMVKNIKDLNSLMDSNDTKIVEFNDNKVKFESSESIKLTLYSNGIALYNGPFRSFDLSITKKFCIDIMDGYFPSELQEKYPDGIKFDLVDKRNIFYKQDKNSVFSTKGYRLGSARTSELVNENKTISEINSFCTNDSKKDFESQISENTMTIGQFLNKLPQNVVKNGKIFDVKSEISSKIKGIDIENPNINSSKPELIEIMDSVEDLKSENVTTLKIKSLSNSDKPIVVKMLYSDTIKILKEKIRSTRKFKTLRDFDIASMYPRKIFNNGQMTLEECDLVPNCNILVIPKK